MPPGPTSSSRSPFTTTPDRTFYNRTYAGSDFEAQSALFPSFNRDTLTNDAINASEAAESAKRGGVRLGPTAGEPTSEQAPATSSNESLGEMMLVPYEEDSSGDETAKARRSSRVVNINEIDTINILRREKSASGRRRDLHDCGHFVRPKRSRGLRAGIRLTACDKNTGKCEVSASIRIRQSIGSVWYEKTREESIVRLPDSFTRFSLDAISRAMREGTIFTVQEADKAIKTALSNLADKSDEDVIKALESCGSYDVSSQRRFQWKLSDEEKRSIQKSRSEGSRFDGVLLTKIEVKVVDGSDWLL